MLFRSSHARSNILQRHSRALLPCRRVGMHVTDVPYHLRHCARRYGRGCQVRSRRPHHGDPRRIGAPASPGINHRLRIGGRFPRCQHIIRTPLDMLCCGSCLRIPTETLLPGIVSGRQRQNIGASPHGMMRLCILCGYQIRQSVDVSLRPELLTKSHSLFRR